MARKRRLERKVDQPPEFDAADFLRKEVSDAKLTFMTFIIALLFTAGSIAAYHAGGAAVGILLGFVGVIALPYLYPVFRVDLNELFPPKEGKLDEDEQKLERRGRTMRLVSQRFTFFFTWLAIFVIALNPPFADVSGPAITGLKATDGMNTWLLGQKEPGVITVNKTGPVSVVARLVDPSGIKDSSVKFYDKSAPGTPADMTLVGGSGTEKDYSVSVRLDQIGQTIRFYIVSQDSQGRSAQTPDFVIKSV